MFLSLWLFVEFVFLGKKQLWFSDLKVIAIQIIVPSISVWIIFVAIRLCIYLHWSNWFIIFGTRREKKTNTEHRCESWDKYKRKIPVLHIPVHLLQTICIFTLLTNFTFCLRHTLVYLLEIGYLILQWILILYDDAAESTDCFEYWRGRVVHWWEALTS